MLLVKQVEPEEPDELVYECYENDRRVGRLVARMRPDGALAVVLADLTQREAGRTLVARLERDALAHALTGLYLQTRDEPEREQFLPAGYNPINENSLTLYKILAKSP